MLEWQSTVGAIGTTGFSVDIGDPLSRVIRAPGPTLHIVFGGSADGDIALASRPAANRRRLAETAEPPIAEPPSHPHRIECTIDPICRSSRSRSRSTRSVTVTMRPGCTSSTPKALLMLKERIEAVYDDLNQRAHHLSNEGKTTLQMLHTYIAPKKPEWV